MKKWGLLVVVLIASFSPKAQNKSIAGYAQSISLKEENGFPGHIYYAIHRSPSGKVYSQTYTGDIIVSSNNHHKRLDSLSRLAGGVGEFHFINATESWYFNSRFIVTLRNDSVIRVLPLNQSSDFRYFVKGAGLIYFFSAGRFTDIYSFTGKQFSKRQTLPDFKIDLENSFVQDSNMNLWRFENKGGRLILLKLDPVQIAFIPQKSFPAPEPLFIRSIENENNFLVSNLTTGQLYAVKGNQITPLPFEHSCGIPGKVCIDWESQPYFTRYADNRVSEVLNMGNSRYNTEFSIRANDIVTKIRGDIQGQFLVGLTNNKPVRIIPYLKIFPTLLNQSGADIFSLTQDSSGAIWAASYKGGIAVINQNTLQKIIEPKSSFLNGSLSHKRFQYLIKEFPEGGLMQYTGEDKGRNLAPVPGYYLFKDRKGEYLYYGTSGYNGIWKAKLADLEAGRSVWEKIDSTRGVRLHNIITISEDKLGRIWAGHPRRGISLYDPRSGQASTWLVETKESPFGAYSSLMSEDGTVWFGTLNDGLWYYDDYTKPAQPSNCKKLQHPLLQNGQPVSGLAIYKKWLLIAATDRFLMMDLDSFRLQKKVVMRYLNPGEHGFSGVTEQNAVLVSKKDSTVWFSNTDMLYQLDINRWLSLNTFTAKPEIILQSSQHSQKLGPGRTVLAADQTSIDLIVNYSSPDLLPRYLSAALIRPGDSIQLPPPSLKTTIAVRNIAQGDYLFVLDIYETDGQCKRYVYPVSIRKYLWQLWWFWLLLGILGVGVLQLVLTQKRRRQLAEAKARTKEAELNSYKAEQEKKLAQLQLNSLTNQFRPHFILNALNTIGAQMDDKPEAESVLSRLGESVNLIFNHAKNQKTLHPFQNEWALVNNIIEIHRMMYLKELKVERPGDNELASVKNILVPMGILQISVENALLHGLNNKEKGPWQLAIELKHSEGWIQFTITDNGIGREKSSTLSNFTKHGTGTKNLNEIISILNQYHPEKISIHYDDGIFTDKMNSYGTRVVIHLPDHLKTEYA